MSQLFDPRVDWEALHSQIARLGEQSTRKSYYPLLQKRLHELEEEIRHRLVLEQELFMNNTMLEEEIAHRQTAEALASTERDNARAIFEAAPVGMLIVDQEVRVLDANRALEAITRRPSGGLSGGSPGAAFGCAFFDSEGCCGETQHCGECRLRQLVCEVMQSRRGCYGIELSLIRRQGERRETLWLKTSVEPITVSGGACAIIAVEDITEHRRMQEEMLRNHKLESLGVLAGGIAHDFNNLLTGVIANLSMAVAKGEADNSSLIKRALQSAEGARELTRQLLTFAKGGAPVKQLVSIADIVKDSAEFALRGAKVACRFHIAEGVWDAEVDVGQLSQVISNLVINADQAMPAGGIIRIAIGNQEFTAPAHHLPAGRYVCISVADEGVGIPPECINRIFDPYFTTKETGTGLGLAMVHSIVTRHGGQIEIASGPLCGSTFTVYLPASDRSVAVVAAAPDRQIRTGRGRVLVMDDEPIIREVAEEMLEMLGYQCCTCNDGEQAIELYRAALANDEPFAAVIMDLTIAGGMGGVEAIARIRALDPAVRAIVSSGYNSDPIVGSHKEYGFKAAVPKPFTMAAMAEALAEVIGLQ
ncbi:hybrid sensor histidine kinase/response regulator [Geomesophilobacter sediminis]|uniref:histidine kinase n=1 Tax=Geomesophilobacter sediminis TaxID=2798584 RepID=A0A8J7JJX2_9BACT|nr:ATP-binding protein [Geomesophilobacter sediminis]MBJ6723350.1 response regulator [Geomesophilobacter sediminis]